MLSKSIIWAFVLVSLLMGCQTVRAPKGSVAKRKQLETDAYGGWLQLTFKDAGRKSLEGEFIAFSNDSVYLLVANTLFSFSASELQTARLIFFNNHSDSFTALTTGGTILGIANGYYGVITVPLVLVVGITTAAAEAKRINFYDYPEKSWEELARFSRFPQGLPVGLDTKLLKAREIVIK